MSLNNKIYREISEEKIAVCEKTAGLQSADLSDLGSASSKVLVSVKIFQICLMNIIFWAFSQVTADDLLFMYILICIGFLIYARLLILLRIVLLILLNSNYRKVSKRSIFLSPHLPKNA